MSSLNDVYFSGIRNAIGALNLTKATLAINLGGAATFKTTSAINYIIDGVFYTKTALAAQAFSAGHPTVNATDLGGTTASVLYVVTLDAAGNVVTYASNPFMAQTINGATVYVGTTAQAIWSNGAITGYNYANNGPTINRTDTSDFLPPIPDNRAPIGIIKVQVNSSSFVPGTTALDAGTITTTYYDVAQLPANTAL